MELDYAFLNFDSENALPVTVQLDSVPKNLDVTISSSLYDGTSTKESSEKLTANQRTKVADLPFAGVTDSNGLTGGYDKNKDQELLQALCNEVASRPDLRVISGLMDGNSGLYLAPMYGLSALIYFFLLALQRPANVSANGITFQGEHFGFVYTFQYNPFGAGVEEDGHPLLAGDLETLFQPVQDCEVLEAAQGGGDSLLQFLMNAGHDMCSQWFPEGIAEYWYDGGSDHVQEALANFQGNLLDITEVFRASFGVDLYYYFYSVLKIREPEMEESITAKSFFNTCCSKNVVCLLIKIRFEVADITEAASYKGKVNVFLGEA